MKTKPILILASVMALTACSQKKQKEPQAEVKPEKPRIFNMMYVEGGEFTMGSPDLDYNPPHQVILSDFYMSDIEVTQGLYEEIMGVNPVEEDSEADEDVNINTSVYYVSWYDALEFCNRLSLRDNYNPCYEINNEDVKCNFNEDGYRLPTEAEWEYAVRGGQLSHGYKFSGSNNLNDVAFFEDNYNKPFLPEVAQKNPNELGIYDMNGSIAEWCWDWFSDKFDLNYSKKNPIGPKSGVEKIIRGDSVFSLFTDVYDSSRRTIGFPNDKLYPVGFRICRTKVDD